LTLSGHSEEISIRASFHDVDGAKSFLIHASAGNRGGAQRMDAQNPYMLVHEGDA